LVLKYLYSAHLKHLLLYKKC